MLNCPIPFPQHWKKFLLPILAEKYRELKIKNYEEFNMFFDEFINLNYEKWLNKYKL